MPIADAPWPREVAQHRAAGDAEPDDDDIRAALGHAGIVG